MRGLTVRQPWASLIATGQKPIETRSWPTKYRGPIAIHAGLQDDRDAMRRFGLDPNLPRGAIVATANLVEVRRLRPIDQAATLCPHVDGRYGWILEDIKQLDPPVPRVGAQGLWKVDL